MNTERLITSDGLGPISVTPTTPGIDDGTGMLQTWQILIMSAAFLIIVIMSAGGNGTVIWIVLSNRRMRSVTNYFLVNLSFADILAIFHIVPNVYYTGNNVWIFGGFYCKLSQFLTAFSVSMSVLTFNGIAFDRYVAIMYPLRQRVRRCKILCAIGGIWFVSFLSGLPGLLFGQTLEDPLNSINRTVCELVMSQNIRTAYDYSLFVLQYAIPLTVITLTYIPISIRLWRHQTIGEVTPGQMESIRSKKRIVKMMIAIVIIFGVCWLPYQLFFMVIRIWPEVQRTDHILLIFICCYWLSMSNCMYNPIIYCIMNKRFRMGFKSVYRCLPCVDWSSSQANFYSNVGGNPPINNESHCSNNSTTNHKHLNISTSNMAMSNLSGKPRNGIR